MAAVSNSMQIMLTLYDYLPSQNAYKVRLLLNHLERPYRQEMVSIFEGQGKTPEFQHVSPTGTVPAIQTEDGFTLSESNAILIFLATNTVYLPSEPSKHSKVMQWLFFEGELVQSGIATLRHWIQTGKDQNRSQEILDSKVQLSMKTLGILDQELQRNPFLGGSDYTIADMSTFAYVHLANEANLPLAEFPFVEKWIARVQHQKGFMEKTYPYSIDPHSVGEL